MQAVHKVVAADSKTLEDGSGSDGGENQIDPK